MAWDSGTIEIGGQAIDDGAPLSCSRRRARSVRYLRSRSGSRFLHAKVSRFRAKNRLPVCLIGSANFSESAFTQNDEALVIIKGRHPGLNDYVQHVLNTSQSINTLLPNPPARNWRGFFRNGYLYFRPSRAITYTIDPYSGDEFREIAARLREQVVNALRFSDPDVLGLNPTSTALLGYARRASANFGCNGGLDRRRHRSEVSYVVSRSEDIDLK